MGKNCASRRWMDALKTDMRLRSLPLAVRCLWLYLVDALAEQPEPGVFMMGSRPGTDAEIARAVSEDETVVQTGLETLVSVGLLQRRPDGAIVVPDPAPLRRVAQSRENGHFGGRPRKGETAEEARARRSQGHLMLPLTGGAETQRNLTETEKPLAGARGLPAEEEAAGRPREVSPDEAHALAGELAALGRFGAATVWHGGPVAAWLRMGATPALLREVFAMVAARASYKPPGGGFGYFERIVSDAIAKARASAPAAETAPADPGHARYQADAAAWMANPRGPMPVLAEYLGRVA